MSYFKCPKCKSEDFYITDYQIKNVWLGKVSLGVEPNDLKDFSGDLRGYSVIRSDCNNCDYSVSVFNGNFRELRDKMISLSDPEDIFDEANRL